MDSGFLSRIIERAKSKDFTEQFALWGSAAAVSYLVYWHFLGKAAHDDRQSLERRLIQVNYKHHAVNANMSYSYRA
jgi:hypothetical protein